MKQQKGMETIKKVHIDLKDIQLAFSESTSRRKKESKRSLVKHILIFNLVLEATKYRIRNYYKLLAFYLQISHSAVPRKSCQSNANITFTTFQRLSEIDILVLFNYL